MSEDARQSLLETLCNVEITRLSRSELRDLGARKKHEREYMYMKRYKVWGGDLMFYKRQRIKVRQYF